MSNFLKIKAWLKTPDNYLLAITFIFLIVGIYFRFEAFEVVRITEWVTRDFDRAFHLFDGDYIPLAGSERNAGGRLLGPFLYFFLAIPLFFKYSYESIYAFNLILNIASLIFFFWLIKKYFGKVTGAFAAILLSVSIVHIDSAGFPINPTFIFPLIFIFLWLLFKIVIENQIKYFSWIFVTISLGIQMHFSLATYYLIPLVACLALKIKITKTEIVKTVLFSLLCFTPYLIYKFQFYEPEIKLTETFFNQGISLVSFLKTILLHDLFLRINQEMSIYGYYTIPNYIRILNYLFSIISFYGLIFLIVIHYRKNNFQKCKKEVLLILTFYIPALIYALSKPQNVWHFWYYFIFIIPMILIKARFLFNCIQKITNETLLKIASFSVVTFISFIALISLISFHKVSVGFAQIVRLESFSNPRNLTLVYSRLMSNLGLTPKEFFDSAFIEGDSVGSFKFLELAYDKQAVKRASLPTLKAVFILCRVGIS